MEYRKFIVTGASKGIGLATCEALLADGHRVIGLSRSKPNHLITQSAFSHIQIDLLDNAAIAKVIPEILKQHTDISGLINNAGAGMFGSLEEFSFEQISNSLQINLLSTLHITRLLIPNLKKQQRSNIVFIGSESALLGARYGSIYSAAKFALRGFSQSLRHECANSNVHVGIINPGMVSSSFFDTLKFTPGDDINHSLKPQDVARAVIQLIMTPDHSIIEEITLNPAKRVVRKKQ